MKVWKNDVHQIHSCFRSTRTSCATFLMVPFVCRQKRFFLLLLLRIVLHIWTTLSPCQPRQPPSLGHFRSLLVIFVDFWCSTLAISVNLWYEEVKWISYSVSPENCAFAMNWNLRGRQNIVCFAHGNYKFREDKAYKTKDLHTSASTLLSN